MLPVLALLSACAPNGAVVDTTAQVCAGWKPILIGPDDQLTEGTASQIEAHDEYGAAAGCWKPPAP